jgi:hypothetical protein
MKDEELLRQARQDFKILHDANEHNKETFIEDMKFAFNIENGQWDQDVLNERSKNGRPALTFNKTRKFVKQVANFEREIINREDVIPVDDKGDPVTAKVLNDIVTDIEYQSNTDKIYNRGGEHAVAGGFGYWRIKTEYTDEGFDQEAKIVWIKNPLLVEKDPKGNKAFIRECLSEDEFKENYPKAEPIDFESDTDDELWYEEDKVWVAEYFRKEQYDKTIVEVILPDQTETAVFEVTEENESEIRKLQILRERKLKSHKVMWYKITGNAVLDRGEWVGKEIPIIEVVGDEVFLGGKSYKQSLITDAKDPASVFNYQLTAQTEKTALAPKAPYMVTPQQIGKHKAMWDSANVENRIYLFYEQTPAGKPERALPPPIDPQAQNLLIIADQNLKDVLGIYGPSLGEQSNERSGKAILARKANSDQGTSQFPNNLREAILETKRQLLDIIPKIYDNARIVRLRNSEPVPINYPAMKDGKKIIINDLSKGRYDYRVKTQTSPSRRQQIAENTLQAMQYAKEYAGVLLPVLIKYSDAAGSEEILAAIGQRTQELNQQQAEKQQTIV